MTPQKTVIIDASVLTQGKAFARQARIDLQAGEPKKIAISIRLDSDILEYMRQVAGKRYQPAINTILRTFTEWQVDDLEETLSIAEQSPPPAPKKQISIRLDEDVLAWFRAEGNGYQTRINMVLRVFMAYSSM